MSDVRTQQARERAEIIVVVCPECGQDDRLRNLKVGARHYAWGKRCEGRPEVITYVRADRVAALETALRKIQDVYGTDDCTCIVCTTCRDALAGGRGQTETPA